MTHVIGITNAVALINHGSGDPSCAKVSDGRFFCWGPNPFGALAGVPYGSSAAWFATPIEVPAFAGAGAVAMGTDLACALRGVGTVECSGRKTTSMVKSATTPPAQTIEPRAPGVLYPARRP